MKNIQYYSHLCACGCGGQLEIRKRHSWAGVPKYISGHNSKGENHPMFGKQHNEKSKMKQSESHKGIQTWNKNLTNELDDRVKNNSEKRKGKKRTEKQKQNISEASKLKNRKITKEHRRILSERFKGENNPNWNNGVSFEPYGIDFNKELKEFIKQRDNYACQCPDCEYLSDKLSIHHIDFNKKNNSLENLITLCINCHVKTNGKTKRNFWMHYYQNIMMNRGF